MKTKQCYNTRMARAFITIYRLLDRLERFLDYDSADITQINHTALHISERRWNAYIIMLSEAGYISGVTVKEYIDGTKHVQADDIRITLKGLQFLAENSLMQKSYRLLKSTRDILPL